MNLQISTSGPSLKSKSDEHLTCMMSKTNN